MQPTRFPFQPNQGWSDTQPQCDALLLWRKGAFMRKRKGCADRRMAGHWNLVARREDSDAGMRVACLRGKNKCRLGECHLQGDTLHQHRFQVCGVRKNGELIALQGTVGKNIEVKISVSAHGDTLKHCVHSQKNQNSTDFTGTVVPCPVG